MLHSLCECRLTSFPAWNIDSIPKAVDEQHNEPSTGTCRKPQRCGYTKLVPTGCLAHLSNDTRTTRRALAFNLSHFELHRSRFIVGCWNVHSGSIGLAAFLLRSRSLSGGHSDSASSKNFLGSTIKRYESELRIVANSPANDGENR